MRYRVDELAARSGVSVDTVRFYQGKGLLAPPEREGRLAWYSDAHVDGLRRVRDLKAKGFSLASIRRFLAGELEPADEALVAEVATATPGAEAAKADEEPMDLEQLAARSGVSPALLAALEREGLLVPQSRAGRAVYAASDAEAVAAGVRLLEAGLPLPELLELAHAHEQAMRAIAERAVDLFDEFVRQPLLASGGSSAQAAEGLVDAFRSVFPATTALVAHHFGRVLLQVAQERIESIGGVRLDGSAQARASEPGAGVAG